MRSFTWGRAGADFREKSKEVAIDPRQAMKRRIVISAGRRLCSQRIGTVVPAFGKIRQNNKRLNCFTLRRRHRVGVQSPLYCLAKNIAKLVGCDLDR